MDGRDFDERVTRERKHLGERLRAAREAAQLSQYDAADKLGTTQASISRFEKGERGLELTELRLFAEIYGKPLSWFTESEAREELPSGEG